MTSRDMKTNPIDQTFGCFDVELRGQWLEAKKSKIRARSESVFVFMSQATRGFCLRNAAAIGLINLIYNLARYEQIVRFKLLPRNAA